jgi:hypothetical protein
MISKQNRTIALGERRLDYKQIILKVINFLDVNIYNFPEYYKHSFKVRENEKAINSCLGTFLNNIHQNDIETFRFYFDKDTQVEDSNHEPDFGVMLAGEKGRSKAFFHIECKRLPARDKQNEKEYVEGELGGIQRFKKGNHGSDFEYSAIVGYIEKESNQYWFSLINSWIKALIFGQPNFWKECDILIPVNEDKFDRYISNNFRYNKQNNIQLHHYWISIN